MDNKSKLIPGARVIIVEPYDGLKLSNAGTYILKCKWDDTASFVLLDGEPKPTLWSDIYLWVLDS